MFQQKTTNEYTITSMHEENFIAEYKERIPTGEFIKPEEIAKAFLYHP